MSAYLNKEATPLESTIKDVAEFVSYLEIGMRDIHRRREHGLTFDSPLECSFAMWFYEYQRALEAPEPFTLLSQVQAGSNGRYRIDFQVVGHVGFEAIPLNLAVELDGHGWHERTREQVQTRDARDRDLQADGWTVQHFSYNEFTNDPSECVSVVCRTATVMLKKLLSDGSSEE